MLHWPFAVSVLGTSLLILGLRAQTTIATGSISGVVTDASGLVVTGAKVTITGKATGQLIHAVTGLSGIYNSGPQIPGAYRIRVEAPRFRATEMDMVVQVGVASTGNVRLEVGAFSNVLEVQAPPVAVDTTQVSVQGVITGRLIDQLPINGRNFLDLAQVEPGVQIQDGTNFDPTKIGYASISFGGRFGRTARISVDGVDVSDETVGTTTQNVPSSGIQEFQLSQSTLDLSNDLTSSGAVNVITRSGSNDYHGELFYLIRDRRFAGDPPGGSAVLAPYQRNQFGGRLGGRIVKNKLFFFADYERTKQDALVPVEYAPPFQKFSSDFGSPFRENLPFIRLDWQASRTIRLFYRFNYSSSLAQATFFPASLQPYKSKNYTRTHVAGADFSTAGFTHSIRFSNMKFENGIADAVLSSSLPLATLGLNLNVTNGPQTGPNLLAPQNTLQLNRQVKYDGGRQLGRHFLRFGVNYNWIEVVGFFSFFKFAPQVVTNLAPDDASAAAKGPFPGGASNPLNYPVETVTVANGQGYSTEHAGLGHPAGLIGPDHRFAFYVGDTWRIRPNLTLNGGLRYVRDTGRTDSDLPAVPQLDALIPGTGGRIRQPNLNFGPQIGIAWNLHGNNKTVVRAGIGLFYENVIFNSVFFDRPPRQASGAFWQALQACNFGAALPISVPGGTTTISAALCNGTVGEAAAGIAAFQSRYQALAKFDLTTPNPNYLVTQLKNGVNLPTGLFAPSYRTPRSLQMNVGVQREVRTGLVLTLDYIRNVTTHTLLGVDANHVGDTRHFNQNAAQQAIAATLAQCGAGSIAQGISAPCPSRKLLDDSGNPRSLRMTDFANAGLTSPSLDFGGVCPTAYGCAFGGVNPNAPAMPFMYPIGRSVYNALAVKLRQDVTRPLPGVEHVSLQAAYALSRFTNAGGQNAYTPANADQDFVIQSVDNRSPLAFTGPALLDRTHQLSFAGIFDLPLSVRAAVISHFYSGLPVTMVVPNTGVGPGEIFRTDFTGDGTVQDLLPGTRMGSLNRAVSSSGLSQVIGDYNQNVANQPTPAGQVLIGNGLFTLAQLQALGAVAPTVSLPPQGQVGVGGLRTLDLKLSWPHRFKEALTVEPSVGFYNLFQFANYDLPPNVISGLLTGSAGSVNGTTQADRIANRVGLGTGVFALGAPRAIEFGVRISF